MRHFKTEFVDETGHAINGSKVVGFLHICKKDILTYCIGCMNNIVKGDQYIGYYSNLMGGERCHLKCYDFGEDGGYLAIKKGQWKRDWIVKLFTNEMTIPIALERESLDDG